MEARLERSEAIRHYGMVLPLLSNEAGKRYFQARGRAAMN
jgi:hypothetical protein